MKRGLVFFACTFILLGLISAGLAEEQAASRPQTQTQANAPLAVQHIRGGIYQVKGGVGANTGFFVGEKEIMVIDAKQTEESARQMIGEIRRVSPLPISRILLTHSDQDHVNGLVGFPEGISVVSQEKSLVHMDRAFKSARERAYLPGITFSERMTVYSAGPERTPINLIYSGPAHTDGDAVIFFPSLKLAFIGDLIFIGRDQLIHRHKNGSVSGLVKVLNGVLALDADLFLSGHSDPVTKDGIRNHMRTIEEKQARVRTLIKEGKTLAEAKKAFNIDDHYGEPGGAKWPSLIEVIYLEETGK